MTVEDHVVPLPASTALERFDLAAIDARAAIARESQRATLRVHRDAVLAAADVELRARARAAHLDAQLQVAIARTIGTAGPGSREQAAELVVPIGRMWVKRHTSATAGLGAPLLVPVGRGGGVRIVAGDDRMPEVLATASTLAERAAVAGPVVVHNPRHRALPRSLVDGHQVTGPGELLGVLRHHGAHSAAAPCLLVLLDFPEGLGRGDRAELHAATRGSRPLGRPLVIHVAGDRGGVDLLHRHAPADSPVAAAPACAVNLWPARKRWIAPSHPTLAIALATELSPPSAQPQRTLPSDSEPGSAVRVAEHVATLLDNAGELARAFDDDLRELRAVERSDTDEIARRRPRLLDVVGRGEHAAALAARRIHPDSAWRPPTASEVAAAAPTRAARSSRSSLLELRDARRALVVSGWCART